MTSIEKNHIVRAIGVRKVFRMGDEEVHALKGVDFKVERGEYVAIMGPSGSGKSTLFNMIGGLDKPNAGKVFIDEVDIAALSTTELAWLRCHKIGYIFQTFNLIPVATALDNVMLPMLFADVPQSEAQDKAVELLHKVGLGERVLHKPVQMSGGQQQRVAVARALANDPAIVLADEPTGNLDSVTGHKIIELLREINETEGVTVISATGLGVSDPPTHGADLRDLCGIPARGTEFQDQRRRLSRSGLLPAALIPKINATSCLGCHPPLQNQRHSFPPVAFHVWQ